MIRFKTWSIATVCVLVGSMAIAETDLEFAMNNGGEILTSNQIAELIVGKVVTASSGDQTFRFFYDPNNVLQGELVNGRWSGTGAFAITDNDRVCVSMATDNGRYRCLTAVRVGETIQKFNTAGEKTWDLLSFEAAAGL